MPFSSSVRAMKATSMTKVAPCSACAGPNTAPRNEWAIITWSRTSTANTEKPLWSGILDELAEYAALWVEDIGEPLGEFAEPHRRHQQGVERRIGQKLYCLLHALPMGSCGTAGRRHLADLARHELEAAAVERSAQRHRHGACAVPAHFQDGRFIAGDVDRGRKPARISAGVHHEFAIVGRVVRLGELEAERARE